MRFVRHSSTNMRPNYTENDRKCRLIQITHDLRIGGLQRVVVNICRSINRHKFDVSVLCLRDLGEYAADIEKMGIAVHLLDHNKKSGPDYFAFLKVAEVLRRERVDVIHTHNTQPFIDGTIAARMSGVRTIIHTDHGRVFPDKKRYMFAEWIMSHFVDKIVGVSGSTSENLVRYEWISPKKILTIDNGSDDTLINTSMDKEEKKKELGIRKGEPIIGVCARLTEEKGVSYLLQGMPAMVSVFPNLSLVVAGEGPLENRLKKEATELGLEENVLFLGPRSDVPELLKLFDLYVLPSISEGLPMIMLEAMAAGCPIVATEVGGIRSVIEPGWNGTLVKAGRPNELCDAIIQLLESQITRQRYAENGRVRFKENFSADKMVRKYEKLYLGQM